MSTRNKILKAWKNLSGNLKKPPEPAGKSLVSPRKFGQLRVRNKRVQGAQRNLRKTQNDWNLYRKYKGSKVTIIAKPANGSLYKAEQELKKAKQVKVK